MSQEPNAQGQLVAATPPSRRTSVVIGVPSGWPSIDLAELWRYRHLLVILAQRDIKVRYKQTVLGIAWVIVQPLVTLLIFATLFRYLLAGGALPTLGDVPYAISTCVGLVVWQLFAVSITQSSNSLVANSSLITRVYFPRLLVPAAPVMSALVDFLIGCGVVVCLIAAYHFAGDSYTFHFRWTLVTLPFFMLLAIATALALALWFAALNAIYRDIKFAVPFITQVLMFATPVVYAAERITTRLPHWAAILYGLNPMVGVVEGFRWALLGVGNPPSALVLVSAIGVTALLVSGLYYFRWMERVFADVV